jgi:ankyrin repeat protein
MQDTNTGSNQSENGVKASLNFFKAIENNDVNELNNMLESGTLSKMSIYAGLMKALQTYRPNSDSIDIILALLNSRDIDSNYVINTKITKDQIDPKDKVTILMYACLKGDLQLVDIIIKNNASVNLKDVNNRNALFYAINADKGDNADIVYALINAGINVNEPEKEGSVTGNTPLTLATQKNMRNTVKALLDNNADPDWVVSKDGNTALHFAVRNSNIDIIDKLLNKNASLRVINKDNLTPLSLALKTSNTDIYKLLCEVHNKIVQKENENASQILKDESTNLANKELSNYSSYQNSNLTPNNGKNKKKKNRDNEESVERKNRIQEKSINLNNNEEENQIEQKTNQKGNIIKEGKSESQNNKNNLKFNNSNLNEESNTQTFDTTNNQSNSTLGGVVYQHYRKRNPKLDLINKMKELKLNNNRTKIRTNPNMHNNNQKSINTNSASSFGLEIPIEFSKKIGDSSQSYQFNSYISKKSSLTFRGSGNSYFVFGS